MRRTVLLLLDSPHLSQWQWLQCLLRTEAGVRADPPPHTHTPSHHRQQEWQQGGHATLPELLRPCSSSSPSLPSLSFPPTSSAGLHHPGPSLLPSFSRLKVLGALQQQRHRAWSCSSAPAPRRQQSARPAQATPGPDPGVGPGPGSGSGLLLPLLPSSLLPYAHLMRLDKPIGTWLLAWPGLWWVMGG